MKICQMCESEFNDNPGYKICWTCLCILRDEQKEAEIKKMIQQNFQDKLLEK